jgi:hypothetical protein
MEHRVKIVHRKWPTTSTMEKRKCKSFAAKDIAKERSQTLQVGLATVNRNVSYLRNQAKNNIKRYIDETLPEEYEKCLVGLNTITRETSNTAHNTEDGREKIQALSLAKECYSPKLDLLTNATVVDDTIGPYK